MSSASSQTFRILSFNMQFGQIWDPKDPDNAPCDIGQTIEEIRRLDPDIVYLQELERVVPNAGQIQPPPNYTALAAALPAYHGFFSYPAPDSRELPFGYGQAILSKTPLTDCHVVDLPAPDLEFSFQGAPAQPTQRLLITARTQLWGRELQLFNTHLQAFFIIDRTSNDFTCQRDVIARHLKSSKLPTLLGGDMNSAPGEDIVHQFEQIGYRTVQQDVITWKRMPYVLDHLFYNQQLELVDQAVVSTQAADHDILTARFRFV